MHNLISETVTSPPHITSIAGFALTQYKAYIYAREYPL